MPGHYIDSSSGREDKSWTKCVVSNLVSRSFILSGYGGQASLFFKDLLPDPEKPIKLGDFLEVTFRPNAAIHSGNLVTDYRSCPPLCPRSVNSKSNHFNLHLYLTVRFKCFLDPGGSLGGLPLYSSQFVDVVDNRRRIPRSAGRRLGETLHHVTAIEIRDPNNERKHVWVVSHVLTGRQMSRLSSRRVYSRDTLKSSSAVSVVRDNLNVLTATDTDRGRTDQMSLLSSRGMYSRVTSPSPSVVSRANRRVSTAKHKKRNRPDKTVPTATDHLWEGSEYGSWCSDTTVDSEADIELSTPSTDDKSRADWADNNPTLVPELRDWWFIDEVTFSHEEEEEELTDLRVEENATNSMSYDVRKRAGRYGLAPGARRLSRPRSPIDSALAPQSEAVGKTADSALLAMKAVPFTGGSENGRRPSEPSVDSEAVVESSVDAASTIAKRVDQTEWSPALVSEQCEWYNHPEFVSELRQLFNREGKFTVDDDEELTLSVTYKCDVDWSGRMISRFSSGSMDVFDHRHIDKTKGSRWKVRAVRLRDPIVRRKHIWVVEEVLQVQGMSPSSIGVATPLEKTPPSKAAAKTADPDVLVLKSSAPDDNGITRTSSRVIVTASNSVAIPPPSLKNSTMVPALVVSRLPGKFIVTTADFDACLYFDHVVESVVVGDSLDVSTIVSTRVSPPHVVTKYRKREPFCYSFVAKCPAGDRVRLYLNVTYKGDVVWGRRMVPCFSSHFVDVIDHGRLIGAKHIGRRWKVRACQLRDPRDRQRHVWAVTKVIKCVSRSAQILAASQEKPAEPKHLPRNVTPRAEETKEKEKNERTVLEVRPTATNVASKPPPSAVVPLDLVVAAETPAITASDRDETKAEFVSRSSNVVIASQEKPAELKRVSLNISPSVEESKKEEEKQQIGSENAATKPSPPPAAVVSLDMGVSAETPALTGSDHDETKAEAVPPPAVTNPADSVLLTQKDSTTNVSPRAEAEQAAKNETNEKTIFENATSKPCPAEVVPLDLVVTTETPAIAVSDCDETKAEMLSLFARAMGDRAVREAIQSANREIYEEIIDRFVGVVFK